MRTATRSILAATAVVGLLAIPVVGAGAADSGSTTAELDLNPAAGGTLSITVPTGDTVTPVDLGDSEISNGNSFETNGLGTVTVSDTRTGIVRTVVLTTSSGLDDATAAFCQDADDDVSGGTVECSADAGDLILLANGLYNFNSPSTSGDALSITPTVPGVGQPMGTASASWLATAGTMQADWDPTFDVTLLGTENAGTFYGAVEHSVS